MSRRWLFCRERAAYHAREARRLPGNRAVQFRAARGRGETMRRVLLFDAAQDQKAAAWHAGLAATYRRAIARPWEAVEPEPPGPPWQAAPPDLDEREDGSE